MLYILAKRGTRRCLNDRYKTEARRKTDSYPRSLSQDQYNNRAPHPQTPEMEVQFRETDII